MNEETDKLIDNNKENVEEEYMEKMAESIDSYPDLPMEFFQDLLHLPNCKRGLPCDDCGRCER